MTANEVFGQEVKRRREALGWGQKTLAQEIGIQQSRISDIEKGKGNPALETMEKIASALGWTLPFLHQISLREEVCPMCRGAGTVMVEVPRSGKPGQKREV